MKRCLLCQQLLCWQPDMKWLFSRRSAITPLICSWCQQQFVPIEKAQTCPGCAYPGTGGEVCLDCQRWQRTKQLLHNQALYRYKTPAMVDFFERYKFHGDYRLRWVFAAAYQKLVRQYPRRQWLYVPIPVDKETFANRGFNQVVGLCPELRLTDCLRVIQTKGRIKQSRKNRIERLQTPQPFALNATVDLHNKQIVLLDDIYTTGQTLYHAQAVLVAAGARVVRAVTLAR